MDQLLLIMTLWNIHNSFLSRIHICILYIYTHTSCLYIWHVHTTFYYHHKHWTIHLKHHQNRIIIILHKSVEFCSCNGTEQLPNKCVRFYLFFFPFVILSQVASVDNPCRVFFNTITRVPVVVTVVVGALKRFIM